MIQRYLLDFYPVSGCIRGIVRDNHGPYVLYTDHCAEVERLNEKISAYESGEDSLEVIGLRESAAHCERKFNHISKQLTAEKEKVERLKDLMKRIIGKASEKPYASRAHHCDFRVILEGINSIAKSALEESHD